MLTFAARPGSGGCHPFDRHHGNSLPVLLRTRAGNDPTGQNFCARPGRSAARAADRTYSKRVIPVSRLEFGTDIGAGEQRKPHSDRHHLAQGIEACPLIVAAHLRPADITQPQHLLEQPVAPAEGQQLFACKVRGADGPAIVAKSGVRLGTPRKIFSTQNGMASNPSVVKRHRRHDAVELAVPQVGFRAVFGRSSRM
jgi:hypothetical protein